MSLMEILRAAQGGRFVANAGVAAGVDETAAAAALSRMGPAIAAQLRKRAEDPQAFEALLDLLEDGDGDAFLDDSNFMDDPELIKDGKAVLTDIFGSAKAARSALAIEARDDAMMKLAAIAASAVLAVLARQCTRPQMQGLMGAQHASSNGGEQGGLFSTIVEAVIKGVVQETTRQLAPKKRRRRTTSVFGTRTRRRTRKRRNTTPSLDQIFGEIIGAIRR